jgi:hypothetical protein
MKSGFQEKILNYIRSINQLKCNLNIIEIKVEYFKSPEKYKSRAKSLYKINIFTIIFIFK